MTNTTDNIPDVVLEMILGAMRNMQFLRYNIPEELSNAIRPLSSLEAKQLQNLHLAYRHGEWSAEATRELQKLSEKAETLALQLEQLLDDHGYTIREKDGMKKVLSSRGPVGNKILFTWMMPEYEEYDGGLLSAQNEEAFLADVMSGVYDDESDKRYLSHMYNRRELREGVISDGDGSFTPCFVDKQIRHNYDTEDDDNMNESELTII